METKARKGYSTLITLGAIILGLLFCLIMQVQFGVPLLFVGLVMAYSRKTMWCCTQCGSAIDQAKVLNHG